MMQQDIKQLDDTILSVAIRTATVCSLYKDADFHDEMEDLFKKGINYLHEAMCFINSEENE